MPDQAGAVPGQPSAATEAAMRRESRRCAAADPVVVEDAVDHRRITVCGQPLAGIAVAQRQMGQRRTAVQKSRQRVLAAAMLSLKRGHLQMRSGHLRLLQELVPCGAYTGNLQWGTRLCFDQ